MRKKAKTLEKKEKLLLQKEFELSEREKALELKEVEFEELQRSFSEKIREEKRGKVTSKAKGSIPPPKKQIRTVIENKEQGIQVNIDLEQKEAIAVSEETTDGRRGQREEEKPEKVSIEEVTELQEELKKAKKMLEGEKYILSQRETHWISLRKELECQLKEEMEKRSRTESLVDQLKEETQQKISESVSSVLSELEAEREKWGEREKQWKEKEEEWTRVMSEQEQRMEEEREQWKRMEEQWKREEDQWRSLQVDWEEERRSWQKHRMEWTAQRERDRKHFQELSVHQLKVGELHRTIRELRERENDFHTSLAALTDSYHILETKNNKLQTLLAEKEGIIEQLLQEKEKKEEISNPENNSNLLESLQTSKMSKYSESDWKILQRSLPPHLFETLKEVSM